MADIKTVPYNFNDAEHQIEVTEGNRDRPLVLLLHGTSGNIQDMTAPASHPDNNYDHLSPLAGEVAIGPRAYPGIGVWSCCALDDKKDVRSWREVLSMFGFSTAAYGQIDNEGLLARPVAELVEVVAALNKAYPNMRIVLLTHSRGGLLARSYLKDHAKQAFSVRTVITLHAPHTGSSLASVAKDVRGAIEDLRSVFGDIVTSALGWLLELADSDAYKEMAIGSPFLTALAKGEAALPGVDYWTFGGVSVRLTRIKSWVYTLDSALPKWRWPPYDHARIQTEVPGASPVADSLPNLIEELTEGRGDLLTADSRTRLPFATHQTNPINHAEALWDPILQAQVLKILGVDIPPGDRPGIPGFWG